MAKAYTVQNNEQPSITTIFNSLHNEVENEVEFEFESISTQPNNTPTTSLLNRAIKCAGNLLLCVFTIPVVMVLLALSGLLRSLAATYHIIILPTYQYNKICGLIVSFTAAPLLIVFIGGSYIIAGIYHGIKVGVEIATTHSCRPLQESLTRTKESISGKLFLD